jgi:hypothetical protein
VKDVALGATRITIGVDAGRGICWKRDEVQVQTVCNRLL